MTPVGAVLLHRPFVAFSRAELERLADAISTIAADLKKGAVQPHIRQIMLAIEEDRYSEEGE